MMGDRSPETLTDQAAIANRDDDRAFWLHQRHNAVDQLASLRHLAFRKLKEAEIKVAMERPTLLGSSLQEGTTSEPANTLSAVSECERKGGGLIREDEQPL